MPSALKFIGGGLLQGIGRGLAETGKEKREAALKKLDQDRAQKRALELEEVKQKNRRTLQTEDRAAQQKNALALKAAPGAPNLPTGYQRTEGGLEFVPGGPADPAQAGRLATAKRDPDGDVTPAQQANNAEIDAARQALDRMHLDRAEILRRTQKSTNTGRENRDYDPNLERLVRTATQRKVGKDLKFNLIHRRYLGPPPEFSEPAGPKALPPGVSAEQPDVFDRIGDFFPVATTSPVRRATMPPRSGTPRAGGRAGAFRRRGAKAISAMSLTEIDDLVNTEGESLSPAELKAIEARLTELGM